MYDKICKVCGKKFQAVNPRYVICSDKCRQEEKRKQNRAYASFFNKTTIGKSYHHKYYKAHYMPVNKTCMECGETLSDGRQSYCLDCLLKDYLHGNKTTAGQRLRNRGYDKEMICYEIDVRGIV